MTSLAITGARIFDGECWHDDHALIIADETIAALLPVSALDAAMPRRRLAGGILAPGFIDLQANGGGGVLLNDTPDMASMAAMAATHQRYGTTSLLPTFITDHPDKMALALQAARDARHAGVPGVIGLHLEGPFIDEARRGAHPREFVRTMRQADVTILCGADCGTLLVTLSPAQATPAMIHDMVAAGIIIALGHSDASAGQASAALDAGARAFTHLFNAMSPLAHRAPGMVGAALTRDDAFCGVICDGIHVADMALHLAVKAKGADRLFLVSDAMPPSAGGPDEFRLQGRRVRRHEGALRLDDGTLAGCDLTMLQALRYSVEKLGLPLESALRMASATPATLIGRQSGLGFLRKGCRADLVHLDSGLALQHVWVGGVAV
ncbi:MAG: N-acetylglucosamine-6-phosphate deacetylase [Hyphomicrobiales bacterium]|nr:N-acetylglucosamine-6-phosphate deacetylase [Hyphomicrobiales bacterium]